MYLEEQFLALMTAVSSAYLSGLEYVLKLIEVRLFVCFAPLVSDLGLVINLAVCNQDGLVRTGFVAPDMAGNYWLAISNLKHLWE